MYCMSKIRAEGAVTAANSGDFTTVIIRPVDIYGENDPYHVDALVNMAKGGFYVRIGNGKARSQHVYVGNIAHALISAAKAILDGNNNIGGQASFIFDPTPSNFFHFFDHIVAGAGYRIRPKNLWIPRLIAYVMGWISEAVAFLIRPIKHYHPNFSRFAVIYTTTDFTFKSDKANLDFEYEPRYTEEEGVRRTVEWYGKKRMENGE